MTTWEDAVKFLHKQRCAGEHSIFVDALRKGQGGVA